MSLPKSGISIGRTYFGSLSMSAAPFGDLGPSSASYTGRIEILRYIITLTPNSTDQAFAGKRVVWLGLQKPTAGFVTSAAGSSIDRSFAATTAVSTLYYYSATDGSVNILARPIEVFYASVKDPITTIKRTYMPGRGPRASGGFLFAVSTSGSEQRIIDNTNIVYWYRELDR